MNKRYLADLLRNEYRAWDTKKVFIYAPTGTGKTTFIVKELLPYLSGRNKKVLLLCNRRLLRMQYWYSVVQEVDSYTELQESIEISTYQKLAETIKGRNELEGLFLKYEVIVCDEAHYFYSDSDFNGFGTYALLQAIVYAGFKKEMIFMTATGEEVDTLIKTTIKSCAQYLVRTCNLDMQQAFEVYGNIIEKNYSCLSDYSRFQCAFLPDEKSLLEKLAHSSKKSVIFIDDKESGKRMEATLLEKYKMNKQDVGVLNAENLEQSNNNEIIRALSMTHKVIPKILITTAVLDNGVSIQDSSVVNVVILTESRVNFIQMLGRVRAESVEMCKLYFIPKRIDVYQRRMNQYEKESEAFKRLKDDIWRIKKNPYHYMSTVWDLPDTEEAAFYRKAFVMANHEFQFFTFKPQRVRSLFGNAGLYINEFAEIKTGDMFLSESRFYALASKGNLEPVYEQMRWIGKAKEELLIEESEYMKKREQEFINYMLSVQNFSQEQLREFKQILVKEYGNEFFADILVKNGTLSSEKLQSVCERYGLQYIVRDNDERRKIYSITQKTMDKNVALTDDEK